MKNLMALEKQKTLSLMSKVLLLVLIVAVMVVVTSVAHAATDNKPKQLINLPNGSLLSQQAFFNPFTLSTYKKKSGSDQSTDMSALSVNMRPQIRIPYRPCVRSVFKPYI